MIVAFSAGFLTGLLALLAIEALIILWVIRRLGRQKPSIEVLQKNECVDLDEEPNSISSNKKGFIWVLEPDKIPVDTDLAKTNSGVAKDPSGKKKIIEVAPVKKYAEIKDHSLIISDPSGTKSTIELLGCTIVAVSSSDLYSRKWDKRYPIKLGDDQSEIYKGNKSFYIYAETSWEKESWCKALRLASSYKSKQITHHQLIKDFHNYLSVLNANYPSFLKPSILLNETTDKQSRPGGHPSRVGFLLKKLAKKASTRAGLEGKSDGETKITDKFDGAAVLEEKCGNDEGTLCLNVLFLRLFFDAQRSKEIGAAIQARIQKTISNIRIPSYIGKITCTGLDLGTVPPYITKMRVIPTNLEELSTVEVEFEYSGGIKLDFETRLEIQEPELQQQILQASQEGSGSIEVGSDLLEGIEQYGNVVRPAKPDLDGSLENKNEEGKILDEEKLETSSSRGSYASRWKSILHSISDQVSQVPLSLEIKISVARGTLRLYVKPPPSDQIWYGFSSMPDMEWNLETCIGDRKITNSRVGSLIGNRFKAALHENMVLPNCGSISLPFMIAEKDDWVERNAAPFIWVSREATNSKPLNTSHIEKVETASIREESKKETEVANKDLNLKQPLLRDEKPSKEIVVLSREREIVTKEEDDNRQKRASTRAKMMDFGRKMGDKLEEKRRHIEEKSRHIVEKMKEKV